MSKRNRQQEMQDRLGKLAQGHAVIEGDTIYTFENHKPNDLRLPKRSYDGKLNIPSKGRFQGDGYFLMFVKSGDARLVDSKPYVREVKEENPMEKLILDQPAKYTTQGQTEQVVVSNATQQKLVEINGKQEIKVEANDVLLVENPMDGIDIIQG